MRALFPAFDDKELDAARFFFGVPNPQVEYFDGSLCIDEWLGQSSREIVQGARNSTMSHFAGIVLKKYGSDDSKAYNAFMQRAENCQPHLDPDELDSIWTSAFGFYENTIKADKNYISPSKYNSMEIEEALIPADFTDAGQAKPFHTYLETKSSTSNGSGFTTTPVSTEVRRTLGAKSLTALHP